MEGLRGFGDFTHFYQMAGLGLPFLDIWVEFPPVFPFYSWLLFQIAGGRQHIYDYLLVISVSIVQAATLVVFYRLAQKSFLQKNAQMITMIYFAVLLVLPYGWWYFDAFVVWMMLLGLLLYVEGRFLGSGMVLGLGILTKLFPALAFPLMWKINPKKGFGITAMACGICLVVYLLLYILSPQLSVASLRSQLSKGSWETVWALVDGNFNTGNFGPEIERFEPENAMRLRGNPARLPVWMTLPPFALLGLWFYKRARLISTRAVAAFLGLTWCIFSLWSPGYSPQWVMYLLPLVLLALPNRQATLLVLSLVLINLLEWPVLLSRGYSYGLWITVPVRTLLWVLLVVEFWRSIKASSTNLPELETDWIAAGHL